MKKYLEFSDEKSSKFWSIETDGSAFTVKFGKVGTAGQTQEKSFSSSEEAEKEAKKLYNSKIKKGYAEVSDEKTETDLAVSDIEEFGEVGKDGIRRVFQQSFCAKLSENAFVIIIQYCNFTLFYNTEDGNLPKIVAEMSEKNAQKSFTDMKLLFNSKDEIQVVSMSMFKTMKGKGVICGYSKSDVDKEIKKTLRAELEQLKNKPELFKKFQETLKNAMQFIVLPQPILDVYIAYGKSLAAKASDISETVAGEKIYLELTNGNNCIVIREGRYNISMSYKPGEESNAEPYIVGQCDENDAKKNFAVTLKGFESLKKSEISIDECDRNKFAEDIFAVMAPLYKQMKSTHENEFSEALKSTLKILPLKIPVPIASALKARWLKHADMYVNAAKADSEKANSDTSNVKYYESTDGNSRKFWCITLDGSSFTVQFGKVGTTGQLQEKAFSSETEAKKEADKLINSKTKKGYQLKTTPENFVKPEKTASKEQMVKAEVPKPKEHKFEIPADVKDNGQVIESDCIDGEEDDDFNIEKLRQPEKIELKTDIAEISAPVNKNSKTFDGAGFNEASKALNKVLKNYKSVDIAKLVENINKFNPEPALYKKAMENAAEAMLDAYNLAYCHIDFLQYLDAEQINLNEIYKKSKQLTSSDITPFFTHLMQNSKPGNMYADGKDYIEKLCISASDRIVNMLTKVVSEIKEGKQEKIKGKKLPEGCVGFRIDVDDDLTIYGKGVFDNRLAEEPFDENVYLAVKHYMTPIIKPRLEKLAKEGLFNDIANEYFVITYYSGDEILVECVFDSAGLDKQAAELEKNIKYFETSENWEADADLLQDVMGKYLSPNGIIRNKDTDRILNILKRYLYSGEEKAEEAGRYLINQFDNLDYKKWRYEYLMYFLANFNYEWAPRRLQELVDEYDYEPAKQKLHELSKSGILKGITKDDDDDDDDDDENAKIKSKSYYNDLYGYGNGARRAMHKDAFNDDDVLTETDTVIARAMSNGWIYLRFKEESEKAYSDALDFLNRLMKKGYSKIHDGYELRVRFLAERMFFPEMAELVDDYLWPDNDSHAFFCKAVHYPSLRDKVAEFARLTLNEFDRYLNLDGEYSTVAGTFAAVAAAMSDVKYMDVAIKFALETDGEHEELASLFSDILDDYYGVTPETAAAIATLRLSFDHDDLGLSKDFTKYPENLAAVMDFFNSTPSIHHATYKICRLANNLFDDAESAPKTLKKLFNNAAEPADKVIYATAHNWFLEALEEEDYDVSAKPIEYSMPTASTTTEIPVDDIVENPPCVISVSELESRGYEEKLIDRDYDKYKWFFLIFEPAVYTNPYIYDAYKAQREKIMGIKPNGYYSYGQSCFVFQNKIAVDLKGAPYKNGMIIFDGKNAEVIYGILDYAAIAVKVNKKPVNKSQLLELRKQYFVMNAETGPTMKFTAGEAIVSKAFDAMINNKYMRAMMQVDKVTSDMGDNYIGALILKGELMEIKRDKAGVKEVYTELKKLKPEYTEYWDKKLK